MSSDQMENRIVNFFNEGNRVILITGGSGFIGKVIIEKLLRLCPKIERIYVLVREKRGKSALQRLQLILNNVLFDKVRELHGNEYLFSKCVAINGDVSQLNLSISDEDRQTIINEVEFIYHCAAIIRFDESLANMVRTNVRGTKLMLDLAKECKRLRLFVYMSTAYCHLDQKVLKEVFYPPMYDPHSVIKTIEWLRDDIIDCVTKKIIGDCPNTYAFSKNLAEGLVYEVRDQLPVILMRPSIVIPIWLEPIPGWTDNINGPTGLLIGAGKGIIRTMYCDDSRHADFVPVDIVANSVLCATWDYCTTKSRRVFHLTTSHRFCVSWKEMIDMGRKVVNERLPLNWVVWYPGGSMINNKLLHQIRVVLYHYLPALFLDFWLWLFGYKPILWKIQQRITKGFQVFEYYANNEWVFENCIDEIGRSIMNTREKTELKLTEEGLDYEDYFYNCTHAARLYILNEPDSTIPTAKRHMKIMWFVDKFSKCLLIFLALYFIYSRFF